MENKWEYDYSGLYHNGQAPYGAAPSAAPGPGPGPDYIPPAPAPAKKGGAGKVFARILAFVLAVAVSFGAGYGGALLALKQNQANSSVIYQAPPEEAPLTADSMVADPGDADLTTVASIITQNVVAITTEQMVTNNFSYWFGGQQVQSGAGSGVIMTEDGYIITNHHVVNGASNIVVTLPDGTEHDAVVTGSDPVNDIAVVKIEAAGLTPAIMGDSDIVQVGETAIAVGNPLGTLSGTVTNGIISAVDRNIVVQGKTMNVLQTNAAVSPGNSGGGLFNGKGQLIGIVNAKSNDTIAEGLGFAIPINTALSIATDLIDKGYVTGRPMLGITVLDVNDAQTAMQYGLNSFGVYIVTVTEGSGAEEAGLQPGDRIIAVGGKLIDSKDQVSEEVRNHQVGDTVVLQIARDREVMDVPVVLSESHG